MTFFFIGLLHDTLNILSDSIFVVFGESNKSVPTMKK